MLGKREMTVKESTSKAGKATYAKYGSEHMAKIAKIGRDNLKKKDPDYYKRLSQAGVEARKRKAKEKRRTSVEKVATILLGE